LAHFILYFDRFQLLFSPVWVFDFGPFHLVFWPISAFVLTHLSLRFWPISGFILTDFSFYFDTSAYVSIRLPHITMWVSVRWKTKN
jgi:hypothetical protein